MAMFASRRDQTDMKICEDECREAFWVRTVRTLFAGFVTIVVSSQLIGATLVVNSTNDPGDGVLGSEITLREAIHEANRQAGFDIITFDIEGGGVQTIRPLTQLPAILDSVSIDGTSQSGFAGRPLIELDGKHTSSMELEDGFPGNVGLRLDAGECVIRGLVIHGFGLAGILLRSGDRSRIVGNYLGVDSMGVRSLGNGSGGSILVLEDSNLHDIGREDSVGRNVISPAGFGIHSEGASGLRIRGNFVGTDWTGTRVLENPERLSTRAGIFLYGGENHQVGGSQPGEGNLISGCLRYDDVEEFTNGTAIECFTQNLVIQGNWIGTDVSGGAVIGNQFGIRTTFSSIIGGNEAGAGNLVSGNRVYGIVLGSDSLVQGNTIGLNNSGTGSLPNVTGVFIGGQNNLIGGAEPGARNLISGNSVTGLEICGGNGQFNRVFGNWIGPDSSGTQVIGNGAGGGIGIFLCGDHNQIGGPGVGEGNVVSGNGVGIDIRQNFNVVEGNLFGPDPSGTGPLGGVGNGMGIYIADRATGTRIGNPGAGNVVSGNLRMDSGFSAGIFLGGEKVLDTQILGNWIGTDRSGTLQIGNNFAGITILDSSGTVVGGIQPGQGNVIANSEFAGVLVASNIGAFSSRGNSIRGNSIFSNGGAQGYVGIDLQINDQGFGVTTNDAGDIDEGPNGAQNFPQLDRVASSGALTVIDGTLESMPETLYAIDFYSNPECDESGYGEGENFLGSTFVQTNIAGYARFHVNIPESAAIGSRLSATATDPLGNTSEFSPCSPPVVSADVDGDGIPDEEDNCDESDLGPTIVITGCDTGVENLLTDDGCTLADIYRSIEGSARNRGEYISSVATISNGLVKRGLISPRDRGRIMGCASGSGH